MYSSVKWAVNMWLQSSCFKWVARKCAIARKPTLDNLALLFSYVRHLFNSTLVSCKSQNIHPEITQVIISLSLLRYKSYYFTKPHVFFIKVYNWTHNTFVWHSCHAKFKMAAMKRIHLSYCRQWLRQRLFNQTINFLYHRWQIHTIPLCDIMWTVHVSCTSLTCLPIIFIAIKENWYFLCQHFKWTLFFLLTEINECLSSPCMNDATCTDNVNSYTCTCADGYTGTNCETGMSNIHRSVYYMYHQFIQKSMNADPIHVWIILHVVIT